MTSYQKSKQSANTIKLLRTIIDAIWRCLQRIRPWRQPSATQLLELADRMRWQINPPEEESPWWVIYDSDHQLGGGIATGKTLREALESGWLREEYIKQHDIISKAQEKRRKQGYCGTSP